MLAIVAAACYVRATQNSYHHTYLCSLTSQRIRWSAGLMNGHQRQDRKPTRPSGKAYLYSRKNY